MLFPLPPEPSAARLGFGAKPQGVALDPFALVLSGETPRRFEHNTLRVLRGIIPLSSQRAVGDALNGEFRASAERMPLLVASYLLESRKALHIHKKNDQSGLRPQERGRKPDWSFCEQLGGTVLSNTVTGTHTWVKLPSMLSFYFVVITFVYVL